MKRGSQIISALGLIFVFFINVNSSVLLAFSPGEKNFGFVLNKEYEYCGHPVLLFEHEKTGAQVVVEKNKDVEKCFKAALKTPAENDKGINHIIEHCVLSGSKTSKVDRMMWELNKFSYNTGLNGFTYPDYTVYPVASYDEDELNVLADYYVDAVFNPRFLEDERIFKEEGLRFELDDNGNLIVSGRAFNEINKLESDIKKKEHEFLFPGTGDQFVSGGHPISMLDLKYQDVCDTYKKYYHPSNSVFFISGDLDYERILQWLDSKYLSNFEKKDMSFINYKKVTESTNDFMSLKVYSSSDAEGNNMVSCLYMLDKPLLEDILKVNKMDEILQDSCSPVYKYLKETGYINFSISYEYGIAASPYISFDLTTADTNLLREDIVRNVLEKVFAKMSLTQEKLDKQNSRRKFNREIREESRVTGEALSTRRMIMSFINNNNPISEDYFKFDGNKIINLYDQSFSADEFNSFVKDTFSSACPKIITQEITKDEKYNFNEDAKRKIGSMENMKEELTKGYEEQKRWSSLPLSEEGAEEIRSKLKKFSDISTKEISQDIIVDSIFDKPCYIAESDMKKLVKVDLFFDINHLQKDDLMYLYLFDSLFYDIGTAGKCFETLNDERSDKLNIYGGKFFHIKDNGKQQALYDLGFTTTIDKIESASEFFNQLIINPNFREVDRLLSILDDNIKNLKSKDPMVQKLLSKIAKCSDEESFYDKQFETSELLDLLENVYKEIDENRNPDNLEKKLLEIRNKIFNKKTFYASSIIGNDKNVETAKSKVEEIFKILPYYEVELKTLNIKTEPMNNFLMISKDISCNGIVQVLNMDKSVSKEKLEVAAKIIEEYYLIPVVSKVIGAYIMDTSASDNLISYMSLFNPNIVETLNVFKKTSEFLENLNIPREDFEMVLKNMLSDSIDISNDRLYICVNQISSALKGEKDFCSKFNERIKNLKNISLADIKGIAKELNKALNESSITLVMTADESIKLEGFEVIKNSEN